jgi:hypothetical protein
MGAATSKTGDVVGAVTSKAGSAAHKVMDKVWEEVSDLTHDNMGLDIDLKISKNLEGQQRVQPLETLQSTGAFPTFTFINTRFDIDVSFYVEMEFSVLDRSTSNRLAGNDRDSKFSSFLGSNMVRTSIGMRANKDVSFQSKIRHTYTDYS